MTQILYENIPIHESGEPLVDLAEYPFIVDPVYHNQGLSPDPIIRVRKGIAKKLVEIQHAFDGKYRFKIWDAHRPRSVQDALYNSFRKQIALSHPELSDEEIDHQTQVFVTKATDPARIPPHATGGTVDLTLVDSSSNELDMGTAFDHFGPEAAPDFFEKNDLNKMARDNRRILIGAMKSAGFTVQDDEWWHFDYGNQVWAVRSHQLTAIYGEAFVE